VTMSPLFRKFVLTAHITFAVGWLGAVAGFLALAVVGLTSQDAQRVRAVYLAAELIIRFVIVPLVFASLVTGLVSSLGTTWGLFRHYWVLVKLLLNILAVIVVLMDAPKVDSFKSLAAEPGFDLGELRVPTFLLHATLALLVLLAATALAVYKPRGMTRYGRRRQHCRRRGLPRSTQDEQRPALAPQLRRLLGLARGLARANQPRPCLRTADNAPAFLTTMHDPRRPGLDVQALPPHYRPGRPTPYRRGPTSSARPGPGSLP